MIEAGTAERLSTLVENGAVLSLVDPRAQFTLAHAEIIASALYWIALPAIDQSWAHVTLFDRAAIYGEGITFSRRGRLVGFLTTVADTPEVDESEVLAEIAAFRRSLQDDEQAEAWARFVAIERPSSAEVSTLQRCGAN